MMARMESCAARRTSSSAAAEGSSVAAVAVSETAAFLAAPSDETLVSLARGVAPQLPPSAERRSPSAASGQSVRCQEGPSLLSFASFALSSSLAKKLAQVESTVSGSALKRA